MKRSNNSGSICLEKSTGKYRAAISKDGKRIVKRFATQDEAERWITITKADIYRGTFTDPSSITFLQFAERFMELYCQNVRPKTYAYYLYLIDKLQPLHSKRIQRITAMDLQECINNESAAPVVKLKLIGFLKRIMTKAVELDLIPKNVAVNLARPQAKRSKIDIFSDDELKRILDYLKDDQQYYLIVLTAALTGMRIGEILGLQAKDITADTIDINSTVVQLYGHVMRSDPKTAAGERVISIPRKLGRQLMSFAADLDPNDYIFHTRNNTPLNYTNVQKKWKLILERADVRYRKLHNLRHTHASKLIGKIPLPLLCHQLGHSSPDITLRVYSHLLPGTEQDVAQKISEAFNWY